MPYEEMFPDPPQELTDECSVCGKQYLRSQMVKQEGDWVCLETCYDEPQDTRSDC